MENKRLAYLFKCYLEENILEEEKIELMQFIAQKQNKNEVTALIDELWEKNPKQEKVFSQEQSQQMLESIMNASESKTERTRVKSMRWLKLAAAAVLLFILGGTIYKFYNKRRPSVSVAQQQVKNNIPPGTNKAILVLSNGKRIQLDDNKDKQLKEKDGTQIKNDSSQQLTYYANDKQSPTTLYNTLITPRGGQYHVVLPDGTKVWLNAASSLHFPTEFKGKFREVELNGEAYLEVAKNKHKPFKVRSGKAVIEVYGTHFNVMAYDDEKDIKTTLLEGAVAVSDGKSQRMLSPGQQAVINKQTDQIVVKDKADVSEAIAWKNGLFEFSGTDVATIMRQISRWYKVNITYAGSIPTGHITGKVSRNMNINHVLKILEISGINLKQNGNEITVLSDG